MIVPTKGRLLYFYESSVAHPQPALVCSITERTLMHGDEPHTDYLLNLSVWNEQGGQYVRHGVLLVQPEDVRPESGHFAEWMPFQAGQSEAVRKAQESVPAKPGASPGKK